MSNLLTVSTILNCKNSMLREGLRHILSSTRFKLCSEDVVRRDPGLAELQTAGPLLFILDASLYPEGVAETVRSMRLQHPQARIVVLADSFDLDDMKTAFQSGAHGYCLATTGCEALIKYLDLVMLGEVVFPSGAFLSAISVPDEGISIQKPAAPIQVSAQQPALSFDGRDSPIRSLSSREAEILHCLMQGSPNKVIARKLDVAEATVKVHIKAILRKIRVANRTQAAMWAVNHFSVGSEEAGWNQTVDGVSLQQQAALKVL
jgi:two-component system nitrate/nitrite response regulator NarL